MHFDELFFFWFALCILAHCKNMCCKMPVCKTAPFYSHVSHSDAASDQSSNQQMESINQTNQSNQSDQYRKIYQINEAITSINQCLCMCIVVCVHVLVVCSC